MNSQMSGNWKSYGLLESCTRESLHSKIKTSKQITNALAGSSVDTSMNEVTSESSSIQETLELSAAIYKENSVDKSTDEEVLEPPLKQPKVELSDTGFCHVMVQLIFFNNLRLL